MPETIKIFVSYCRQNANYLENDSLLGFFKGLENDIRVSTVRNRLANLGLERILRLPGAIAHDGSDRTG